jgi:hypothetical protein
MVGTTLFNECPINALTYFAFQKFTKFYQVHDGLPLFLRSAPWHVGSPGIDGPESKSVGDVADGLELSVGIDVLPSTV